MKVTFSAASNPYWRTKPITIQPQTSLPIDHHAPRFGVSRRLVIAGLITAPFLGLAALYEATTGQVRDAIVAPSPETTLSDTVQIGGAQRTYVKATRHYPMNEKRILTPMASSLELELLPMDPTIKAGDVFAKRPTLGSREKTVLTEFMQRQFFDGIDEKVKATMADPNADSNRKYQALWNARIELTPREQRDPTELAKTMGTLTLRNTEMTVRVISAGAANGRLITNFTH